MIVMMSYVNPCNRINMLDISIIVRSTELSGKLLLKETGENLDSYAIYV